VAVYLPTINRFVHGDNLAMYALVPPDYLLLTPERAADMHFFDGHGMASDDLHRYDDIPSLYLGPQTLRRGRELYLHSGLFYSSRPDLRAIIDQMCVQSGDFNLRLDETDERLTSNPVPIQDLDELSG